MSYSRYNKGRLASNSTYYIVAGVAIAGLLTFSALTFGLPLWFLIPASIVGGIIILGGTAGLGIAFYDPIKKKLDKIFNPSSPERGSSESVHDNSPIISRKHKKEKDSTFSGNARGLPTSKIQSNREETNQEENIERKSITRELNTTQKKKSSSWWSRFGVFSTSTDEEPRSNPSHQPTRKNKNG